MLKSIFPAALSAMFFLSSPVLAQQDTTAPADGTATEAADGTTTEAEAPAANAGNKEVITAVHGDWQLRCRADEAGEASDNCFMYQLAKDSRDMPVAEVSIVPIAGGGQAVAGFTIVTPLKSMLPKGLLVQIDNGKPQQYPFLWCAQVGCFARYGVDNGGLNRYKRGGKARMTVYSIEKPDAPIILDISLTGFTAAINELSGS